MFKFFLLLFALNLYGFLKYIDFSIQDVSYRKQMATDFICPIGSFIGRIVFKFKIKENPTGYIFGFFLELFLTIIFLNMF